MGRMCAVYRCGANSSQKSGISIHKFPDEPSVRRAWVNFVKRTRKDFTPTRYQGICAQHFYSGAFADEFTAPLFEAQLGYRPKRKLKPDAVPTLVTEKCAAAITRKLRVSSKTDGARDLTETQTDRSMRILKRSLVKDQRYVCTEAGTDRMEQQDPVVKTEVKLEIDVAEEPPQSWYMAEKDPHDSQDQGFVQTEASSDRMEQDPVVKTEVKIEIDVAGEPPQSWYMTENHPHVPCRKDAIKENTASLPIGQTSKTEVVPCNHSDAWPKQEVSILLKGQTSNTETSHSYCDCLKQEVTENQCNKTRTFKTDVKPGMAWSGNRVLDCDREPDIQGTFNAISMEQDTCILVCSANTAAIQGRDVIIGDDVGSKAKKKNDVQPFTTIQPTDNSILVTISGICSESRRVKGFPDDNCLSNLDKDVRNNISTCNTGKAKPHACQQCNAKFTCSRNLKRHMLVHSGRKPYACQQCDAKFIQFSCLKRHLLIHTGQKPHACEQCDAKFTYSCNLKKHMFIHTKQKPYVCQQCDARFSCPRNLKRHNLIHTGPHACHLCGAKFTCYSNLNQHTLRHTGQKPHGCQHCDAKFTQLSCLRRHMSIHTGQKPHACQQCDAKFTRSSNLKQHMLVHTGQKPHACEQCDATFTQSRYLKCHMLIHLGQKHHACQQCDAKFTRPSDLKRHVLIHKGQKHHACQQCDAKFTRPSDLKRHMLTHKGQKHHV